MTDDQRFIAVIGMAILIILGLLLPYAGPNRRRLIAITSIYRPISLMLLVVHCTITMTIAILGIPYSPFAPMAIAWALALMALEIRSSHRGPENHIRLFAGMAVLTLLLGIGFVLFTEFALSLRTFTQSLFLTALLVWLVIEAVRARRIRRNNQYTVVLIALVSGLVALGARNILFFSASGREMTSVAYESRHVLQLRFIAYGFLCFALLALNNAYSAQFWRSAVFQRRAREMTLVTALRDIAQVRDNETGLHISRTRQFVRVLAGALLRKGKLELPHAHPVSLLARAAPLHDVGKVAVPDRILRKAGRFTPDEQQIMRAHAVIGAEILRSAAESGEGDLETSALLDVATEIAGGHHEHWDGSGYPKGLAGAYIPQSARIMAVADVYDALTSARAYKAPWSHEEAASYIKQRSGTKFDPDVVAAFEAESETFRSIAQRLRDTPPKARLFS